MKLPNFGRASIIQQARTRDRLRPLGWIVFVVSAIAVIVFVRAFLLQTFKIPSGSMQPTLEIGDHIVVSRFVYGLRIPGKTERVLVLAEPERHDVVVFSRFSEFEDLDADTHYIKRIVGVPGDTIRVEDYRTYVNDKLVGGDNVEISPELRGGIPENAGRRYGPVTLNKGEYFVLGDNLSNSRDSRFFGPINAKDIEGRAIMVYWSWRVEGNSASVRWDRVGKIID